MKKTRIKIPSVLLCLLLFVPVLPVQAEETCVICSSLAQKGFPEDYRESLCALQLLHPEWSFMPLFITALSESDGACYDFSYVLEKECEDPKTNLVFSAEIYAPYRSLSEERYDTGLFSASREAVAYFLDPRSHLSEEGVFQFLLLSENRAHSPQTILLALTGSAAEKLSLKSEESVASFLVKLGEEMGIDPLHLAFRLRQEQGVDGSPLLFGTAGTVLSDWAKNKTQRGDGKLILSPSEGAADAQALLSLDGYYNPFHANTSGQGAFAVYKAGADWAREMGWDSLEKGLRGGAEKIRSEYIATYQTTLYLQKWNVDIRSKTPAGNSRNFWGQYMQNIGGSKSEAKNLFAFLSEHALLDFPYTFSIPVYESMPAEPCPDPAAGACPAFSSAAALSSPHLFYSEEAFSPLPDPADPPSAESAVPKDTLLPENNAAENFSLPPNERIRGKLKKTLFSTPVRIGSVFLPLCVFLFSLRHKKTEKA